MFGWFKNAPYVDSAWNRKIHTSELGNLFGPVSATDAHAADEELTHKKIIRTILVTIAVVLPIVLLCVATIPWTTNIQMTALAVQYTDGVRQDDTVEIAIDGKAKNYLIMKDAFDAKLVIGENSHRLTDEVEAAENSYYTNVFFHDGDDNYWHGRMAFNKDLSVFMIVDLQGNVYLVSPEQEVDLQQAEQLFPSVYDTEDTAQ